MTKDFFQRGSLATAAILSVFVCCVGQSNTGKLYLPFGTFHQRNSTTIGLSLGLASTIPDSARNVTTIGVHAEAIGIGLLVFMAPRPLNARDSTEFLVKEATPSSERIHGIAVSPLGSMCDCTLNGIGLNGAGTYVHHVNGISAAWAIAESDRFRGLQAAGFNLTYQSSGLQLGVMANGAFKMHGVQLSAQNEAWEMRGVQIGLYNRAKNLKGFQIGIWNVNQKRRLPFFNWA